MVESELAAPATTATAAPIAIKVLTLRPATVVPAAAPAAAVPVAGAAAGAGVDWAIACAEAKHRIAEAIRIFFMRYPFRLNSGEMLNCYTIVATFFVLVCAARSMGTIISNISGSSRRIGLARLYGMLF